MNYIKFFLHGSSVCFPPQFVHRGFNPKVALPEVFCNPQQALNYDTQDCNQNIMRKFGYVRC